MEPLHAHAGDQTDQEQCSTFHVLGLRCSAASLGDHWRVLAAKIHRFLALISHVTVENHSHQFHVLNHYGTHSQSCLHHIMVYMHSSFVDLALLPPVHTRSLAAS